MNVKKLFFIIVCGEMVDANSGCATKTTVRAVEMIGLDSIQTIEPGQLFKIRTSKKLMF
jgi:hypothetical protein